MNIESSDTRSNKRQLAIILAIPVIVVAFSSLMFFLAQKNIINLGTVNIGTLIQPPVQLSELHPQRNDGSEYRFNQADSKWLYAVVGGRDCTGACERMLYLTRQTHIALGKKTGRVERVYVSTEGDVSPELQALIAREHSDMTVLKVDGPGFAKALPTLAIDPFDDRTFYVVDPLGWVMMYYRADDTELHTLTTLGKAILKDMKRLLR